MTLVFIFILGLIVGSFLNAVIHRLHSGETIFFDRSRCVFCHAELAARDLVPLLSFLFLKGRCRYCHKPISWQYPIVELVTAVSFSLSWITDHGSWINFIFISILIIVAVYDFKHYLILDKVVLPAFVLAATYNLFIGQFWAGILGSAILAGFFALQYLLSRGRWIGFGDVKFGLFLGSLVGWQLSLVLLFIAYVSGAVIGLGLIATGKKTFVSQIPFGTILSLSAIIVMLYGEQILARYLGI